MMLGHYTYLFLIVVWAVPIIVAQWAVGWRVLRSNWRAGLASIFIATLWLTVADSVALRAGTWVIVAEYSTGIFLPGRVPIEEAVFFLVTNTLIVQALLLLRAREARGWFRRIVSTR